MQDIIELKPASIEDAVQIYKMQQEAFRPLYEKYHDDETSPVKETLDRIRYKISEPDAEFYIIRCGGKAVGAIRIRHYQGNIRLSNANWISPVFVIPAFQNHGIAQKAIQKVFALYPQIITWKLDTIKQEAGNCYLYEKCGFVRTGKEHIVNEYMTLVEYERQSVV